MRESYTNPSESKQIESFEIFGLTNQIQDTDLFEKSSTNRIHHTNFLKKALQIESTIQIFKVQIRKSGFASPPAWIRKDLFRARVLRILQDSLDSWKQVKSLEVQVTNRILNLNL